MSTCFLISLTQPEVVEPLDSLLELDRDVHVDVLIEAGLAGHEGRQRGPVVGPDIVRRGLELLLPPGQLGGLPLQLLLSPLQSVKQSLSSSNAVSYLYRR